MNKIPKLKTNDEYQKDTTKTAEQKRMRQWMHDNGYEFKDGGDMRIYKNGKLAKPFSFPDGVGTKSGHFHYNGKNLEHRNFPDNTYFG